MFNLGFWWFLGCKKCETMQIWRYWIGIQCSSLGFCFASRRCSVWLSMFGSAQHSSTISCLTCCSHEGQWKGVGVLMFWLSLFFIVEDSWDSVGDPIACFWVMSTHSRVSGGREEVKKVLLRDSPHLLFRSLTVSQLARTLDEEKRADAMCDWLSRFCTGLFSLFWWSLSLGTQRWHM